MIVDNSGVQHANIESESLASFDQNKVPFTIYKIVNLKNLGYAAGVNKALRWLEENQPPVTIF